MCVRLTAPEVPPMSLSTQPASCSRACWGESQQMLAMLFLIPAKCNTYIHHLLYNITPLSERVHSIMTKCV